MRHIDNINIEIDKEKFRELLDLKDGPKGDQGETGAEGPIGPSGLRGENGKHGESGKNGKDGKDGEPGIDGEDGSPDTPIEIRDKLELLEGNYRLDAKAIKNLPMAPAVFAGRTKGFIESITDTASVDLIVTTGGALSATVLPAGVDHGALAGLGADDHTQYALLAGRATGQILVGGTAANDDLTLRATENATDGDIIFQSDPTTETMRITSVGRVGIGEPIPTSLLQVRGGGTAPTFRIDNDAGATGLFIQQISGTPTANYVDINDGVGAAIFDIDSSGDVGIGVASPTAVLHLKAGTAIASTAPLKLTSGTNLTAVEAGAVEFDGTALTYTTSTPTRIRLLGNSLGISGGTTLIGGTGTTDNLILRTTSGIGTTGADIIFQTGNNGSIEAMRITNDGKIGIRTTTPNAALDVSGGHQTGGIIMGGDLDAFTRTHNTRKLGRIVQKHYSNAEEDILVFAIDSQASETFILYGGGAGALNCATTMEFITGATNTTTSGVVRLKIAKNGNVSFSGVAGTARLHLPAGTATASTAPLKFTLGTNLTTPENGAVEYNGTNLFFTRAAAARENVVCASAVSVVSPTSPNRTITVNIDGSTYYISAKTTND